jgi:hypothetical protein
MVLVTASIAWAAVTDNIVPTSNYNGYCTKGGRSQPEGVPNG